jgi:outer membrane lipoprotein-sorting protein
MKHILFGVLWSGSALAIEPSEQAFLDAIGQMSAAVSKVTDTTYVFHQREWAQGKQQPAVTMEVKYRLPGDVYMKWVGEKSTGRELVYRGAGWNDGQMRVNPGPWIPTMNLDPMGTLALRGQRHNIHNLGFHYSVKLFAVDSERILANPEAYAVTVEDEGVLQVYGESARCLSAVLPKAKEPAFYASKIRFCLNERTKLPAQIQAWDQEDGALRLVEEYGFEQIKTNVGLQDSDFDPENSSYTF